MPAVSISPAAAEHLVPVAGDVAGTSDTFTKDGITVTSTNGADLRWVSQDGSGIGIAGGGSDKVWPAGETLNVALAHAAETITVKIADIGANNLNGGIDFKVYVDGNPTPVDYEFAIGSTTPVGGVITITLDASSFGGDITGFDVYSVKTAGGLDASSFLLNDVTYSYPGTPASDICDVFEYTLTDGDGDISTALLTLKADSPVLKVGKNVDDADSSTTSYEVGDGTGDIVGTGSGDILVGDVGGASMETQEQDYNIALILDVSGSMSGSKLTQLKSAVTDMLNDFNSYNGGDVKVHFVPFATSAQTGATFDVGTAAGLAAAISFVNGLSANGYTNYEDPMQDAIAWLSGSEPISGAENYTYFVSDGEPNRYVNNSGGTSSGSAATVMDEIGADGTPADGTNEIASLQSLSTVIGIGIGVSSTTLGRLDLIDSNGDALNASVDDLSATLTGASPLNQLSSVGDDVLTGGDGGDMIFGDALFTDGLASAHGLSTLPGSGWEVFARLEAGESATNPDWTRADTISISNPMPKNWPQSQSARPDRPAQAAMTKSTAAAEMTSSTVRKAMICSMAVTAMMFCPAVPVQIPLSSMPEIRASTQSPILISLRATRWISVMFLPGLTRWRIRCPTSSRQHRMAAIRCCRWTRQEAALSRQLPSLKVSIVLISMPSLQAVI